MLLFHGIINKIQFVYLVSCSRIGAAQVSRNPDVGPRMHAFFNASCHDYNNTITVIVISQNFLNVTFQNNNNNSQFPQISFPNPVVLGLSRISSPRDDDRQAEGVCDEGEPVHVR